jgi:hypothetical protein
VPSLILSFSSVPSTIGKACACAPIFTEFTFKCTCVDFIMDRDVSKRQVEAAFAEGSDVPVHVDIPPMRSKAGFVYVFKWTNESNRNDWKSDQYNWRGNSTKKFECAIGSDLKKLCFKIRIAHGEGGESFSNAFSRLAITDDSNRRVLVFYKGDESNRS